LFQSARQARVIQAIERGIHGLAGGRNEAFNRFRHGTRPG
jgi:hypothetical protein